MYCPNHIYSKNENQLIEQIDSIDLLDILRTTDNLSFEFVVNYILNEKYQKTRKEKDITLDTVANYQQHLIPIIKELINSSK